jgi:hypothetical protein
LQYAGRDIKFRIPYNLYAELDVDANTNGQVFPEAAFLHNVDKPFEIHRWFFRVTGLDAEDAIVEPQPTTLEKRVKVRIQDVSKNENVTKNATTIETLQLANEGTWEYDEPYTLVRSEGFQVQLDVGALPLVCANGAAAGQTCTSIATAITQVRTSINLQGYLVVVAPPTEER